MSQINKGRYMATLEGEFVVFLIGARINNFWAIHQWLPVALGMPRMLQELRQNPELGLLGVEAYVGRTTLMLQYWRSLDQLMDYAHAKTSEHLPTWRAYNDKLRRSGAFGIWHETYVVKSGGYENIYGNMPAFGLARVAQKHGKYELVTSSREQARQRLVGAE